MFAPGLEQEARDGGDDSRPVGTGDQQAEASLRESRGEADGVAADVVAELELELACTMLAMLE